MISTIIKIQGRAGKRREIIQTVKGLSEQIMQGGKCLKVDLHQDLDDKNILYILEDWPTREELEKHMASKLHAVLLGLKTVLAESVEIHHAIKL